MPFPLIILGALALAGGGAYYAFSGARGGPLAGPPAPAGRFSAAGPGRAAKPPAKPKKPKKVFGAPTYATTRGPQLSPAARHQLMSEYAKEAARFEADYDRSKNKEGFEGFRDKVDAAANVGGAVLTVGLAGDITDVTEFGSDLRQQLGPGRPAAWKGHEISAARAASLAQSPPDLVTKGVHHGEEYAWTRYVILVPGYGLVTT